MIWLGEEDAYWSGVSLDAVYTQYNLDKKSANRLQ